MTTETRTPGDALHDALDAVPYSIHGREADWVDGSGDVIAGALVDAGWTYPGAARQAQADDLASEVERLRSIARRVEELRSWNSAALNGLGAAGVLDYILGKR